MLRANLAWVKSFLLDQCKRLGVLYFFKELASSAVRVGGWNSSILVNTVYGKLLLHWSCLFPLSRELALASHQIAIQFEFPLSCNLVPFAFARAFSVCVVYRRSVLTDIAVKLPSFVQNHFDHYI